MREGREREEKKKKKKIKNPHTLDHIDKVT
jgi:hypothetical protein